ncbi:NAD(P)/FAD-dependent oxidoreductase [Citricoccus sp. I39-566]|uniref:NAD(P)/FAD-dependent oxidoreductase n=1 Tax=Citricoccus sp. I39-566 TaxID=3073268 RepID=UPI00286BC084|nr:NAD(P)/FAD-dependent oxidoreductase [Citricoccus sp. I39-566]WMY78726.1 NAD(P)/FAD-dependent oxidoreductase [Citricoccus sp. I39-566]
MTAPSEPAVHVQPDERAERVDVLVVGAGLAGLHAATLLARARHRVVLAERRPTLTGTVRTTGIFVRRTLEDFDLPEEHLGPPIRRMMLYPPGLTGPVELVSSRDEYRVGDMGPLYVDAAREAEGAGVDLRLATRFRGRRGGVFHLEGPGGEVRIRARFVVGADGARSRVARELGLSRNTRLLMGAEEVVPDPDPGVEPTFHCVVDPRVAPGYLAWVLRDGEHVHVGTAGHATRFPRGLYSALRDFGARAPGLEGVPRPASVEKRAGPIPVGGVLPRIAAPEGLLVGDAAGAVSPLTAGGLDPCLRLSGHAAEVLDEALRTGRADALERYDGQALRARFRKRLLLRRGLDAVRTPEMASAALVALRTPPGRALARRILFSDGSFPLP